MKFPNWQAENWRDAPENPVIRQTEGFILGEPQILTPGELDTQWHAFMHSFYGAHFTPYFQHHTSADGIHWSCLQKWQWPVSASSLFFDKGEWILYYTAISSEEERAEHHCNNFVCARTSKDLAHWSEPVYLLFPELPFEREHMDICYESIEARCPCMVKLAEDKYRLYYSAGTVMLEKCGYEEPKYVTFAEASSPLGPFKKYGAPVIAPDAALAHRNFGAGALKVFGSPEGLIGLYNSIYNDENGYHHSAINLIRSSDGIVWEEAPFNPMLPPAGEGWKAAFVYQLDLVRFGDALRLYYNARNDWRDGVEAIGFSSIQSDFPVFKLWGDAWRRMG
ncbi:MAG: hypothetical protein LBQ33_03420 [Oscillospiraceae bacterium]|nr:hypothetical protein [Oscillospiraceae bacterium]